MRRYAILDGGVAPHFVTLTLTEWLPVFLSDPYCRIVTDSLSYCRANKGLLVHAYVIMPTHSHAVLSVVEGGDLSAVLRDSRKFMAKEIVAQLQRDGNRLFEWVFRDAARKEGREGVTHKVWQVGTHPETLVSEKFVLQKTEYLHNNPVSKGLVAAPEHWRYSSAGFYLRDEPGPLEVDRYEL